MKAKDKSYRKRVARTQQNSAIGTIENTTEIYECGSKPFENTEKLYKKFQFYKDKRDKGQQYDEQQENMEESENEQDIGSVDEEKQDMDEGSN